MDDISSEQREKIVSTCLYRIRIPSGNCKIYDRLGLAGLSCRTPGDSEIEYARLHPRAKKRNILQRRVVTGHDRKFV